MILIPKINFLSSEETNKVHIEIVLHTLNVGDMANSLSDIISCWVKLDDLSYRLKGSIANEHWFTEVDYKEIQLCKDVTMTIVLPSKTLEFKCLDMYWEHI